MAILDTIFRALLSQLIFRPRVPRQPAGLRRQESDADRRLYAAGANHWGLEAEEPATRSYLDPESRDGEDGASVAAATSAGPRGRRFGLPPVAALPAPNGLLACGAVDRQTRSFSDRRR
jgi:hypothetical protein